MSFGQLYFSFKGRISRSTFWLKGILLMVVTIFVVGVIDVLAETDGALIAIWQILLIWPALAIQVKRWHDRDKSGWWMLIVLVPLIGSIWALVECGFLEGTPGDNRFGPEPL